MHTTQSSRGHRHHAYHTILARTHILARTLHALSHTRKRTRTRASHTPHRSTPRRATPRHTAPTFTGPDIHTAVAHKTLASAGRRVLGHVYGHVLGHGCDHQCIPSFLPLPVGSVSGVCALMRNYMHMCAHTAHACAHTPSCTHIHVCARARPHAYTHTGSDSPVRIVHSAVALTGKCVYRHICGHCMDTIWTCV